jgi:hypothetical protein
VKVRELKGRHLVQQGTDPALRESRLETTCAAFRDEKRLSAAKADEAWRDADVMFGDVSQPGPHGKPDGTPAEQEA